MSKVSGARRSSSYRPVISTGQRPHLHPVPASPAPCAPERIPASRRRARRVSFALLGLAWLAFTYPILQSKVHFPTDFGSYFFDVPGNLHHPSNGADTQAFNAAYPWHAYLGNQLRSGQIPMWDSSRFLGVPYAADPSMGTFYPPNWLYAVGSVPVIATVIWAATVLASLLLAFWFLSLLRLHPFAAALGAIAWTFGGFMTAWGTGDAVLGAAVWLPMALGGLELARRGAIARGVTISGLALALSALAGQPQVAYYVWVATGIWALGSTGAAMLRARRSHPGAVGKELARGVGTAAGAFVFGLGLASVQILGTLEYAGQLARQKETVATLLGSRIPAALAKTLLIPDFFGNPVNRNYSFPATYYTEAALYAGVVTLPLAAAGILHRNRRLSLSFGLLALAGAGAAFGTPLLHLLFLDVPLLARFGGINHMVLLMDAGLAGLAALGLDALISRTPGSSRVALRGCALLAVAVAVLAVSRWGTNVSAGYVAARGLRGIALLALAGTLLVLARRSPEALRAACLGLVGLVGVDLWLFGFGYHAFQPNTPVLSTTPEVQYLATEPDSRPRYAQTGSEQLPLNASMVLGLYSVNGYDPLRPASLDRLLDLASPSAGGDSLLPFPAMVSLASQPPVLDLLGVHSLTAPNGGVEPGVPAFTGRFTIFDEAGAFPPAFVATCWATASDDEALARMRTMTSAGLRSTALVTAASVPQGLPPSPASCDAGPAVTLTRYDPQDVAMTVPASSRGGLVVLTDQWYPGWTATVDGRDAPILRVDTALRAVAVGPGSHTIEYRYAPRWPLTGLCITALTAALIGVVHARRRLRRR
ncbi:MAG: hypothetical protein QOD49_2577 [Actinomycetota bacterium]|nr:hypothetical protein [Actinomycetota bacterium]